MIKNNIITWNDLCLAWHCNNHSQDVTVQKSNTENSVLTLLLIHVHRRCNFQRFKAISSLKCPKKPTKQKPAEENPREQDCFSMCAASVRAWANRVCPESLCTVPIKPNRTTELLEMHGTGLTMISQKKGKRRKLSGEPLRDVPRALRGKKKTNNKA